MPYKDKEAARACWRRRNATPKRKAYMRDYIKERVKNPELRQQAYEATKRWNAKPKNLTARAAYVRQRRTDGKVPNDTPYRISQREKNAGRPRAEVCEVCGRDGRIVFDHCHAHGHFRGWICIRCNTALGMVNDDPRILRKLIAYLQRNRTNTAPQMVLAGI